MRPSIERQIEGSSVEAFECHLVDSGKPVLQVGSAILKHSGNWEGQHISLVMYAI